MARSFATLFGPIPLRDCRTLRSRHGPSHRRDRGYLGVVRAPASWPDRVYKLVCIPCDVYVMVGWEREWGTRQLWTHFDGYQLLQSGKLRSLVGGDVRYGGRHDLVSIACDNERDRVISRFAVVRRERLVARWL